ncbi:multidrug resistance transporter [Pseudomonas sp. FW306-02-F02-AA]|uniref:Multidrug transporter n=1 Tax=Pseudomonas fluorescens TaxID=294 RepID=A0A0N9WFP3_PSEFL|nr:MULTISPECIES: TolC family protein [Pseudomonas]ALI00440.1 multidrug transporter [Pseudomonas fluorescens]PMZ01203.1 multidrug resistance transporter [Pseudomonas sp. FW306-02-F02-AB]PMZ07138.1 multidrug resistance transporter [Pseudomonas sp. FW306-02-H06C]PMZ16355.1 multidrug resistance transporter [Pseudomonas sp. FW306-02-F02-AA]PMZ22296.1 multidrug resistance transporter [Pseudomonas sp. FW306-02-F08-AA]
MRSPFFTAWHGRLSLVGMASIVLAGCAAWTTHQPAQPHPERINALSHLPQGVSAQALPERWWQLYNDPKLDALVQQALEHNRDLAAAQAHVQSMLAGIMQADAERWPSTQASLGAAYGKTTDDQTLAKATDSHAPSQWAFNPGFELAYQVDIWGQVQHAIERAQVQAAAAQDAEDLLRITIVAQTTRAYVNACVLGARAKVERHSLEVVGQSLALIDRQRQAGVVTDFEYVRMQALQGETLALLPMLEARRQAALYELAMLTGVADLEQDSGAATCEVVPKLNAALPVGDGWQLLARRPDIRQAERVLQAASLQVDIVQADLYPKVTFGASVSSSSHTPHELGDSSAVMFGIGPLISWQFPNWRVNRARVNQARALEQVDVAQFEASVLKALKEVRQALALYDGERQRHAALSQALDSSRQAYKLAQLNYNAGSIDFLDVLDSERELIRLQATRADADGRLLQRQIALFSALGGGWQSSSSDIPVDAPSHAPLTFSGTQP